MMLIITFLLIGIFASTNPHQGDENSWVIFGNLLIPKETIDNIVSFAGPSEHLALSGCSTSFAKALQPVLRERYQQVVFKGKGTASWHLSMSKIFGLWKAAPESTAYQYLQILMEHPVFKEVAPCVTRSLTFYRVNYRLSLGRLSLEIISDPYPFANWLRQKGRNIDTDLLNIVLINTQGTVVDDCVLRAAIQGKVQIEAFELLLEKCAYMDNEFLDDVYGNPDWWRFALSVAMRGLHELTTDSRAIETVFKYASKQQQSMRNILTSLEPNDALLVPEHVVDILFERYPESTQDLFFSKFPCYTTFKVAIPHFTGMNRLFRLLFQNPVTLSGSPRSLAFAAVVLDTPKQMMRVLDGLPSKGNLHVKDRVLEILVGGKFGEEAFVRVMAVCRGTRIPARIIVQLMENRMSGLIRWSDDTIAIALTNKDQDTIPQHVFNAMPPSTSEDLLFLLLLCTGSPLNAFVELMRRGTGLTMLRMCIWVLVKHCGRAEIQQLLAAAEEFGYGQSLGPLLQSLL